jgi:hypothetical protein
VAAVRLTFGTALAEIQSRLVVVDTILKDVE